MSNILRDFLIAAIALTLIGIIIMIIALVIVGWNFKSLSTVEYETNTYELSGDFENIYIDAEITDIVLLTSNDDKCRIDCKETKNIKHKAEIADKTLRITSSDTRNWFERLTLFSFDTPKVMIYLPGREYSKFTEKNHTGDTEIPGDFSFKELTIESNTSNIDCRASAAGIVNISTSTGNVDLDSTKADSIKISVSTGHIELTSVEASGNAELGTSTGHVALKDTVIAEKLDISTGTGSVSFDNSDASELEVGTGTGSIRGSLRTPKIFIANSNTGSINAPETTTGGKCKLTTSTGSINIEIAE